MNLRIEVEIGFQDTIEVLDDMLVDFADVLVKYEYGNEDDDDAVLKSYMRVRKLEDDEVILVVVPMQKQKEEVKEDESTS